MGGGVWAKAHNCVLLAEMLASQMGAVIDPLTAVPDIPGFALSAPRPRVACPIGRPFRLAPHGSPLSISKSLDFRPPLHGAKRSNPHRAHTVLPPARKGALDAQQTHVLVVQEYEPPESQDNRATGFLGHGRCIVARRASFTRLLLEALEERAVPATSFVADIWPGTPPSYPEGLLAAGGQVYFTADDGATGRELWRYDP